MLCLWQGWFAAGNAGPMGLFGQLSVDLNEVGLLWRQVFLGIDGADGAFWDAHGAVYALVGVYDQHVLAFTKTIDGANIHAVGIFALNTGITYNMHHGSPPFRPTLFYTNGGDCSGFGKTPKNSRFGAFCFAL
jgi:hypothetical protein